VYWMPDCDTDHYLIVAKVKERLVVSKQITQQSSCGEVHSQEIKQGRV
jgi:hypothetical protein